MEQDRERLAAELDAARAELGLTWREVAARAGMTAVNLQRIRNGEIRNLTPEAASGLERALAWQEGDVEEILRGGHPTPLVIHNAVVDMTPEELGRHMVAIQEAVTATDGPAAGMQAAQAWMAKALRLRHGSSRPRRRRDAG
jgi:transcriptional regulator with XRE-family HTH domain